MCYTYAAQSAVQAESPLPSSEIIVSDGKMNATTPSVTYNPQQTHIGTDEVTSENVAINGAVSEARRPKAMSRPHPKPRFSVLMAWGVYLKFN